MGSMRLIFTPMLVRHLLGLLGLSGPIADASWTHSYANKKYNPPQAAHPRPPPTPYICATCNIIVAVKSCLKSSSISWLASRNM